MKTLLPRSTLVGVAAAALLAFTVGCAGLQRAAAGAGKASAKSDKSDIAACEKMCAVAGDAEDNKAGVEKCKKKCHD